MAESLMDLLGLLETNRSRQDYAFFAALAGAILAAICWGMLALLRKEAFAFTHYPLRFNRATRIIHYFRFTGEVASVPWDDVFFYDR